MTAKSRRQLAMLAVTVVVLVAVVRLTRDVPPSTGTAGTVATPSNPARGGATPAGQQGQVADVQLERLTAPRGAVSEAARNPFRFQVREAPAPVRPVRPPAPVIVAPPAPTGPPPPPPIALKFIGILDAPARIGRVAILSDSRGNVFYGKEGDIIEGWYRVVNIGTESVELAYADGRGRQTIRLSGQ